MPSAVRFIVVELKVGRFDPRDTGQLSFYASTNPARFTPLYPNPALHGETIGILLCTSRDDQVVEYSLASTAAPVAVATYTYDQLTDDVRQALPPADSITRASDTTTPSPPHTATAGPQAVGKSGRGGDHIEGSRPLPSRGPPSSSDVVHPRPSTDRAAPFLSSTTSASSLDLLDSLHTCL